MTPIVLSTALWGAVDSCYVQAMPETVQALAAQDLQDFRVVFHAERSLIPVVLAIFNEHAPDIVARGGLEICDLSGDMCNNRMATSARLGYIAGKFSPSVTVLMLDADDVPCKDYVSVMHDLVQQGPDRIVAADLHLFGEGLDSSPYLSRRLEDGQAFHFGDLLDGYYTGFSNTAFQGRMIEKSGIQALRMTGDALDRAPDWWVALNMLGHGGEGVFTTQARIKYRQHEANLSGITLDTSEIVLRNVEIKRDFFAALHAFGIEPEHRGPLGLLAGAFNRMNGVFKDNPQAFDRYYRERSVPATPFWHENAPAALGVL